MNNFMIIYIVFKLKFQEKKKKDQFFEGLYLAQFCYVDYKMEGISIIKILSFRKGYMELYMHENQVIFLPVNNALV